MLKFENKTNGRFYYLSIERDLLNDLILRIVRGGHSVSLCRTVSHLDPETMLKKIQEIIKKRIRRGYTLV